MTERYQIAAWRHYNVGMRLSTEGFRDDAGYHFGVAGENAVKYALQASGVETAWNAAGINLQNTPMRKHFPSLQNMKSEIATEISLYATGRLSGSIARHVTHPNFANRFQGWQISIRYADTDCTPVSGPQCAAWEADAVDLLLNLTI